MIRVEVVFGLIVFALWVFCLIEVIVSRDGAVRQLPKLAWLVIVLLFPLAGSIAWLVVGRPAATTATPSRFERPVPEYPEYDRPGRATATNPEADAAFLRQVRERAEQQRRAYRDRQRREAEGRGEAGEN
ncbi:PLD nuclease N-terminal domain-containing protein [uncultured Friedmanniella sp.]|uniref:PLD nuclease N-terminal domain-containing protein n=1 Tax=uncultured Friedmanniella sp. TaxID=335381 RepID=UPI0035CC9D29